VSPLGGLPLKLFERRVTEMSESESEEITQRMTEADRIDALWLAYQVHQKDIETLTRADYLLLERLVAVEKILAPALQQQNES
jgi:hypothetical protein